MCCIFEPTQASTLLDAVQCHLMSLVMWLSFQRLKMAEYDLCWHWLTFYYFCFDNDLHVFIGRCTDDETVQFYKSPAGSFRFSIKSFRFRGYPDAMFFVHCDAAICDSEDKESVCARSCQPRSSRKRRAFRSSRRKVNTGELFCSTLLFLIGSKCLYEN